MVSKRYPYLLTEIAEADVDDAFDYRESLMARL